MFLAEIYTILVRSSEFSLSLLPKEYQVHLLPQEWSEVGIYTSPVLAVGTSIV